MMSKENHYKDTLYSGKKYDYILYDFIEILSLFAVYYV